MKHMKKLFGLLLAVVMVFAMSVSVFADTVNVKVDGSEISGHEFWAYQIFTGTQSANKAGLGDPAWGNGIEKDGFLNGLKKKFSDDFGKCTVENVEGILEQLSKYPNDSDNAESIAKIAYANIISKNGIKLQSGNNNSLETGYYLIVDQTKTDGQDMAANAALLQVTTEIRIKEKTDKPTVEKKVLENSKYPTDEGYGEGYNDVADYNEGDMVPFHLIGKIPDMTYYDTYQYVFHDTLSRGFDAPSAEEIHVYLSESKALVNGKYMEVTTGFNKTVSGTEITVSTDDLKDVVKTDQKYKYVIVEYSAKLNQSAVVGLKGNENEVYLEYSNKPDQSGSAENRPTGETKVDKVIVFTYQLNVTKVDGSNKNKKLENAEFKLYRSSDSGNEWAKVSASGNVEKWVKKETDGSVLTSDAEGKFHVIGLDDGTYFLREIKAPDGYNTLQEDVKFTIEATTENSQNWITGEANDAFKEIDVQIGEKQETGDTTDGSVSIEIENNQGSQLPETGGIGTTIFYVVGGILMAGAAILLITKKKMSNK